VQPLLAAEAPSNHSLREFMEIGIPVVETRRKSGSRAFRVKKLRFFGRAQFRSIHANRKMATHLRGALLCHASYGIRNRR
jgi:hypothetical protein